MTFSQKMDTRPLLLILLLTALCLAADHRKIHRPAGGHLRIINPDPDDSELMKMQASRERDKKQKTDDRKENVVSTGGQTGNMV
ncbi:hypothetical protein NQ317_011203 [Molorchus minor]|uniref:Uncharacterized protein n=1 Tax=Molorchus minor TaxID=1323400 RepID=A0ABQ9JU93_9CUCU|nr:hypothetical protein NQ317_011203 [Molorchus minor]